MQQCILFALQLFVPLVSSTCTDVVGCFCQEDDLDLYYVCSNQISNLTEIPTFPLTMSHFMFYQQHLDGITDSDLSDYRLLREIDLQSNGIKIVSENAFKQNTLITELRLNDNKISNLPIGLFTFNTALVILLLDNNKITTLPSAIFDSNVNLERLYLQDNLLTTIQSDVFRFNTALKDLHLDRNNYHYFDISFPNSFISIKCSECFICECLRREVLDWINETILSGIGFYASCLGTKFESDNLNSTTHILRQEFETCYDEEYVHIVTIENCHCSYPSSPEHQKTTPSPSDQYDWRLVLFIAVTVPSTVVICVGVSARIVLSGNTHQNMDSLGTSQQRHQRKNQLDKTEVEKWKEDELTPAFRIRLSDINQPKPFLNIPPTDTSLRQIFDVENALMDRDQGPEFKTNVQTRKPRLLCIQEQNDMSF